MYEAEEKAIRAHKTRSPHGYNLERGGKTDFVDRPGKPADYRVDIRTEDIARLRQAGKPYVDIAHELGCDRSLVRNRLKYRR